MLTSYRIGIFIVSFILTGLFFFSLTERGYAGSSPGGPPCCELEVPEVGIHCDGGDVAFNLCSDECLNAGDCIFYEDRICVQDDDSPFLGSCQIFQSNIPTLGEWGLISLAVILGAAGYMVIRRRKASA